LNQENSSLGNFFLDISFQNGKIVLMKTYLVREKNQDLVLIKDIEQELNITKSVASNLVKRMVQNGLVELEASPSDKRAKFVRLTDKARSQMQQVKAFFERIDKQLMEDIDEDELLIFEKVLSQLQENIKRVGGDNEEISQKN